MKKLMSVALGLCLFVPLVSFAQATGGSTGKDKTGATTTKVKKHHGKKGGHKGKKSGSGTTTTPPPK